MPISDGNTTLRKVAFQIGDKFFRFAINPENYTDDRPHRTTAIKTKSRIVIEDFQSDIPTITISGTTGFNPTGQNKDRGINKIKEMKRFIEEYAKMGGNGNTTSEDFYFHNFTNDESFVVHLSSEGVKYVQSVESPLTYRYEIKFVVLRKASEPADEDIVNPEIGNRYPSVSYNPVVPNTAMPMPTPVLPNNAMTSPNVIIDYPGLNSPSNGYDPSSGNPNIYNEGTTAPYQSPLDSEPINPQAPSPSSYFHGMTGLGYSIGYYGRSYSV
jgi:hypothetical protein